MKKASALIGLLLVSSQLFAEVRVTVLGVTENMDLIERWATSAGAVVKETATNLAFRSDDLDISISAPKPQTSPSQIASVLRQADIAMIVMDTTQGPLPINREHIIISRQALVPVVTIMMANVDELYSLVPQDAREFLGLEESEIREVLSLYEMGGEDTLLFHDSATQQNAPRSAAGGLRDVTLALSKIDVSRPQLPATDSRRSSRAQIYLLTDPEADGHAVTIAKSASMEMWVEGASVPAEIVAQAVVRGGDVAEVTVRASTAFAARDGSRILLIEGGHVVGIGALIEKMDL